MEVRPFKDVNILDFTWTATGPTSLNVLSFYGANIIKVESRERSDTLRSLGPFKDGIADREHSYAFAYCQAGKRYSITLNMEHPRARGLIERLVKWADIVADSYVTGTIEKWGLDYENLKKIKPDIIMLRTCMHGHTGPLAGQAGQGFILTALTGFDSLISWPDRAPSGPYGPFTDWIVPMFNTISLIAALENRRLTGKGQYIDQSQHEAALGLIAPLILDYTANRQDIAPAGNRIPYAAPHGIYRCKGEDRWCAIAVFSDEEWLEFCKVIGRPSLSQDLRFSTLLNRKRNEDELDRIVESWTGLYDPETVMNLLQASGVAAGLVSNGQDLAADPQLQHYRFFEEVEHPAMGRLAYTHGPSFKLSETDYEVGRANLIGEHNDYVFSQVLGFSDEEWSQLVSEGVI
ncbi:MAG: CoA transferase [Dehalococcoidales bacterium]|nr:CoA transferase [Dehalococcoidales bacterium]